MIVVSVAIGKDYVRKYSRCLESHARYAEAMGYEHLVMTEPVIGNMTFERYVAIQKGLEKGHEWALHIDIDAYVNVHYPMTDYTESCPCEKDIIVMKECDVKQHCGLFGCLNAGVMFVRNTSWSMWFTQHMQVIGYQKGAYTDQDYFNSIYNSLYYKIDIRPWTMKHSFNGMLSFRAKTFHTDDFIIHFITSGGEDPYIDTLLNPKESRPGDFIFTNDQYSLHWEKVLDMIPIGAKHPMHVFRLKDISET